MPTIEISKKELEKLVGKLPLEKLKDRISLLGTDLESIEGDIITVEIFPNRPDLLSLQGFARALASFTGKKTGLRNYKVKKSGQKMFVEKSLPKEWPYAFACIVKGIKFNDERIKEVIQVQEKLGITMMRKRKKGGIGFYPLEKIEFPIRFIGKDPNKIKFRPLEYPKEITGRQILSKHPTGREYAHICQHWKKFPIFVDNKGKIMSMPPIINSHDTGKIDETTRDVFLEITGNDFNTMKHAINIMVTSLADMGGQIYSINCIQQDKKTVAIPDLKPEKIPLKKDYANKTLGLNLKEQQIKKLLARMGHNYTKKTAQIPAYRADIMHPIDLVEDIAIAYGYENFKEEIPTISTIAQEDPFETLKRKIATFMTGFGIQEVSTYHLTNKADLCTRTLYKTDPIELEKASSTDYNILRTWLIPSLLQVLRDNKHNEYPQKIFEISTTFEKAEEKTETNETNTKETQKLAFLSSHKQANYTEAQQILDSLFHSLNIPYKIEETIHPSFIPGRVGCVRSKTKSKNKILALIGELNPQVLSNFQIENPTTAFEIDLDKIAELVNN